MAVSEIHYDPHDVAFTVGGKQVVDIARDDAIVAALAAVADVSLSSFECALTKYENEDGATASWIFIADVPVAEFDPDTSPRQVWLSFLAGRVTVQVAHGLDEDGGSSLDVPAMLGPLLARHSAEVAGDYRDDQGGHLLRVYLLGLLHDERTIGELHSLGVEAQALLDAASGSGALTAAAARDLVASGRTSALLGEPESSWIDAKSIPHSSDSEAAAFELAKDVAAFANTGRDAIIVYGVTTAGAPGGGDVLDALRPFKLSSLDLPALRNTLADRLTPLLTDLELDAVEARGGYGFGWIYIPAQPTYIRPVLVRGALAGEKVIGTHVSVPFRVGEDTRHWDASTVHSLIQAGRAALERAGDVDPAGGAV